MQETHPESSGCLSVMSRTAEPVTRLVYEVNHIGKDENIKDKVTS